MSTFTKGPWVVDGNVIRGDHQRNGSVTVACVLDVAYPYGRWAGGSTQPNARLISAAPDLYEALVLLVAGIESKCSETFIPLAKARAALAKAEGKS